METLEWANSRLFHETPPKKIGSIFKIKSFSMDLEAVIPIDLPKKVIYRRR
jgi:hypothetical protein